METNAMIVVTPNGIGGAKYTSLEATAVYGAGGGVEASIYTGHPGHIGLFARLHEALTARDLLTDTDQRRYTFEDALTFVEETERR